MDEQQREIIVRKIKENEYYRGFKSVLEWKETNEEKARSIIVDNRGVIKPHHIQQVFDLVDEKYTRDCGGDGYPWFGRLISSNGKRILNEDINKINKWFDYILDKRSPVDIIDNLSDTKNQLHLDGANVGLITLVLYLVDKSSYSIWFKGHHEALQKLYPEIGGFTHTGKKYIDFNNTIKAFASKYGFRDSELDFIFAKLWGRLAKSSF